MLARKQGARNGPCSAPELIEVARREAGVGDASVLESPGLAALCQSLTNISNELHFMGRRRAQRMLIETLVKRLRVKSHIEREPTIRQIRLQSPIFLIAPFRTGTTLLHRLLAQDPAHRTPRLWEALQAPPAEPEYQGDARYFERDHRVAVARRYLEARERYTPKLATIHPSGADLPEECFGLLETSLLSHSFMFYGPVTEYLEWLDQRSDRDWEFAYGLYADQLRLLQWWWPGERWILKSPFHMWAIDALCATFPDALIVQQHRAPAACMASFCSLIAAAYGPILVRVDREQIGRIAMRYLRDALARNVAARRRLDPGRFIDIDYAELVADPLDCARRVYEAAGTRLGSDAERRMRDWLGAKGSSGGGAKHEYALGDYGLAQEQVDAAFAEYSKFNPCATDARA